MNMRFVAALAFTSLALIGSSKTHGEQSDGRSLLDLDLEQLMLEEIVVSAQKRLERVEDVPLSLTVFTREQIEKSSLVRLEDYANFTPGLNAELGLDERDYDITIRGIGQLGGQASNFGLYLDEFELTGASPENVGADLADVQRIEVLRGPQGTAFGRNVIAGAINISSIAPSPERTFGTLELEGANHGSHAARGAVNLPLPQAMGAARLSGSFRDTDGYLKNVGPSGQSNDYEHSGFRAAILLTPLPKLEIDAAAAMQKFSQGRPNAVTDGHLIGSIPFFRDIIDAGLGALPPGSLPAGYSPRYPTQNKYISTDTPDFLDSRTLLTTLRAQYHFDRFSLVSVSGNLHSKSRAQSDYDDSEYNLFIYRSPFVRTNFRSTELRVQSNDDARLGWIAGVYYSSGNVDSSSDVTLGSDTELITSFDGVPLFQNGLVLFGSHLRDDSTSRAVFGELTYPLTRRIKLTAGLRYNDDRTRESQIDSIDLLAGGPLDDETQHQHSSKVTGRTSILFEPWPGMHLYGTVARGYRAGGIQLATPDRPTFGPEEANNFELGAKVFFFERRLSLSTAVFHTDWNDVQVSTFDFVANRNFTDNIGKAEVYGTEIELRALPLDGLGITAGVSLLHTEIKEFTIADPASEEDPPAPFSFAGFRLPNAANFTASVVVDYEHPMFGSVKGFVRSSYLHMSKRLESLDDPYLLEYLPAYDRVDLRLGLRGQKWMAEAFGENVFDEIYSGGVLLSGYSLTGSSVTSPRPSYGIRVSMNF